MKVKKESEKAGLKLNSHNEDHGNWSHHFMANRWGNKKNSDRLYFLGLKNHGGWWTAVMKLKMFPPWMESYDKPEPEHSFMSDSVMSHQAPLSMKFSKQEYWSGLPFPSPRDLPNPWIKSVFLASPELTGQFFTNWATRKAKSRQHIKKQRHHFADKGLSRQSYGFSQ